jgi:hypothetical protein
VGEPDLGRPDDEAGGRESSHRDYGKIGFPNVNTGCSGSERDVGSIVHDHGNGDLADDGLRELYDFPWRRVLESYLNARCASAHGSGNPVHERCAVINCVIGDGHQTQNLRIDRHSSELIARS